MLVSRQSVAIHNKNGQGLLLINDENYIIAVPTVAIHNKNGQGLLLDYIKRGTNDELYSRNPQ